MAGPGQAERRWWAGSGPVTSGHLHCGGQAFTAFSGSAVSPCQTTTGDRGLYLQVEGGIGALRKRQVFWVRNEATSEPVFSVTRLARLPACSHSQLVFQSLTKQDYKSPVDRVGLLGCVFAGYKISQSLSPSESD